MHSFVSSCPRTEDEFFKASTRLGCGNDINGHNQYICIPNEEKTSLVELCYNEGMGVREKGNCLEATVGKLIEYSCKNFLSGCPNDTFFDYGFYKYPACQNINTKLKCYVMDPFCPPLVPDDNRNANSDDALVYACSILGGVMVLLIAVFIVIILWQKKKFQRQHQNPASATTSKHPSGTLPKSSSAPTLYPLSGTPPRASSGTLPKSSSGPLPKSSSESLHLLNDTA